MDKPFKLVLSIEHKITNIPYFNNKTLKEHVRYSYTDKYYQLDITDYEQLEIEILEYDFYLISDIINNITLILNFFDVVDINNYLSNFKFQKPITPFVDDLLDINKGFYITNKIDGLRKLLIISNKDGYILTYKNSTYYDDLVYKIKYSYKNSLDVLVKNNSCYKQDINGLSLISNVIYDNKYNNGIVEVLLKNINNKYYSISIKERTDKIKLKFKYTINSIFSALNYGLDTDIFTNNSILLLRRYHNFIKQRSLSNCINNYTNPTLIDIGSGNGADFTKMGRL
ncbi:hypothetical protein LY90DRAFT_628687 [Neocallimastix californiae]|uniref:Uncharacterized protein n=1 Tax=Neocallimastix californiae TaxID=1754190 RepID=A0A1Y2AXC5_9FUNG|nr:hypothetical protein LY90DRAFT_628687 [Neocallimastix californiae]|eukprot:ORY27228.1 hypothetical protein LY90DRAFT_628687 [Neocallimastix californiae]